VEPGGFNTPFGFVSTPVECPYKDKVNLFFRAEETTFCEAGEPHLCGRIEKCVYLGDHMQLKVCCNSCNSCARDNKNQDGKHSILLKSPIQSWAPGDVVRFRLKNYKVKSAEES
jgi:iron(III) transport system ATP-binding protein